jgi:hypothetical protein
MPQVMYSLGVQKFIDANIPQDVVVPLKKAVKLATKAGLGVLGPPKKSIQYDMDDDLRPGDVLFYVKDESKKGFNNIGNIRWLFEGGNVEFHWRFKEIVLSGHHVVNYEIWDATDKEENNIDILLNILHVKKFVSVRTKDQIVGFIEPDWKRLLIGGNSELEVGPTWFCFRDELVKYADSMHLFGTPHGSVIDD